jgi:hypothetical protein
MKEEDSTKDIWNRIFRGWTSEELNSYCKLQWETHFAGNIASPKEVINVILTKYILMLYKFKLRGNNIGKLILDKVVMDMLYTHNFRSKQILFLIECHPIKT